MIPVTDIQKIVKWSQGVKEIEVNNYGINKYVKTIYNDNSMKVINKKPGKPEEVHTISSDLSLAEIADLYYRST
ncbi:hypothetical protein N9N56_00960 [Candidatus Pelagibacter ubique]|nr:hypothetical protein [Candidatus Pelagibacter ubique]